MSAQSWLTAQLDEAWQQHVASRPDDAQYQQAYRLGTCESIAILAEDRRAIAVSGLRAALEHVTDEDARTAILVAIVSAGGKP